MFQIYMPVSNNNKITKIFVIVSLVSFVELNSTKWEMNLINQGRISDHIT